MSSSVLKRLGAQLAEWIMPTPEQPSSLDLGKHHSNHRQLVWAFDLSRHTERAQLNFQLSEQDAKKLEEEFRRLFLLMGQSHEHLGARGLVLRYWKSFTQHPIAYQRWSEMVLETVISAPDAPADDGLYAKTYALYEATFQKPWPIRFWVEDASVSQNTPQLVFESHAHLDPSLPALKD